jgi:hypothetical protein
MNRLRRIVGDGTASAGVSEQGHALGRCRGSTRGH